MPNTFFQSPLQGATAAAPAAATGFPTAQAPAAQAPAAPIAPTTAPAPTAPTPSSPQMTLQQFGDAIKNKYPQYSSMDSTDVANKVLAKYPQYQSAISQTQTPPTTTNQPPTPPSMGQELLGVGKGALSTIAGIGNLGMGALDQTLGRLTSAATGKGFVPPPVNPKLEQTVSKVTTASNPSQQFGKDVEQVGEFLIPGGAEEEAATAAEKLATEAPELVQKIAKYGAKALTSAGLFAGLTAAQEGSLKDALKTGTTGGILSLISEPVASLIEKIPETAWSSILKRTPAVAMKDPDLPAEAAKTGIVGLTRQAILDKAGIEIANIEQGIDSIVKNAKGDIPTSELAKYVQPLRDAYSRIPGEEGSVKAIDGVMESLNQKEKFTVQEAQQLKKDIYQHISKSYGKGLMEISPTTETQKQIARGLKTELEKLVPGIGDLNKQHAVYNGIQEAIDRTLARQEGKGVAGTGLGLYDLLTAGIGESAFGPVGALAATGIKKATESPAVLSGVSKAVSYFNDLSPTAKMMFYNGLKGLIAQIAKNPSKISKAASNVGGKIFQQAAASPVGQLAHPTPPVSSPPTPPTQ